MGCLHLFLCHFAFEQVQVKAAPVYVDAQFELPSGFHIYKLAENYVTGGSYDIVFDGQGRILVGDTDSVRRLEDKDEDGLYESYKVIATGLGAVALRVCWYTVTISTRSGVMASSYIRGMRAAALLSIRGV